MPNSVVGDLEAPGAFASAVQSRARPLSPMTRRSDVIMFVCDERHTHYAHNLLLNLAELGLAGRALAIGNSALACQRLIARSPADSVTCGYSSYLRSGTNATVDRALRSWRIGDGHVYHLWYAGVDKSPPAGLAIEHSVARVHRWQRWHYLGWAVRLGYNALSLDTDISLRADPYVLLHGPLGHRQLFVGLDSEASGAERPGVFPMINVGFVYCRRCATHGPAHRLIADVPRRMLRLLMGPTLYKTRNGHSTLFLGR